MTIAYLFTSLISVFLWTPILIKFYRSWSSRRNPVSLAICASITLIMWTSLAGMWVVTGKIDPSTLILATAGMSGMVAVYVHVAFYLSKVRFNDQRSKES